MRWRLALLPIALLPLALLPLAGCGTANLDFAGNPDKQRDRLYAEGRIGGDKGLADVDLREAWRAVADGGR